jgi:hypothetical protein
MTRRKKEAIQAWAMGIGLILVLIATNYIAMNI